RTLVNRVFVFIFGMSVDAVQRQNDFVPIDAARGGGGVEHRDVSERPYHHQILNVPFAQETLQLTAEELIKSVGIDNWLGFPALEWRGYFLHGRASGMGWNCVNDRHAARTCSLQKVSQRFHKLRADFLRVVTARA